MRTEADRLLMRGAFLPAMPLALNEDRQFDEEAQRRLIRYYLESGADGVAVAVHTTQFAIRDPKVNLFERVLRVSGEEMDAYAKSAGRVILKIAGVCGETAQALSEARIVKSLGYDAILVSPGGLGALTETQMIHRTEALCGVLDAVGFYLQPAVGGRRFSYDYWRQICAIPGVRAIKCAAFNRYLTLDVARAIAFADHEIALYTGNDDSIIADLLTRYRFQDGDRAREVATRGGLLGHWAVWTRAAAALFREIKALAPGAPIPAEYLTLAAQITDANRAFFDADNDFKGCIAGIHEVLRRQGLMKGVWCIDPNEGLSQGQAEAIDRVYRMYPALNDDAFVREFLQKDARSRR